MYTLHYVNSTVIRDARSPTPLRYYNAHLVLRTHGVVHPRLSQALT